MEHELWKAGFTISYTVYSHSGYEAFKNRYGLGSGGGGKMTLNDVMNVVII